MTEKRNILLLGRTGSGKSAVANVLLNKNNSFEEVFEESSSGVSVTSDLQIELLEINVDEKGEEKVNYRIVDTVGVGDTKLTPQGVLYKLGRIAHELRNGLNQVLFVTKGRFTKEEAEAYDLLSSIIFDSEVIKYTTIVRTGFEDFLDEKKCEEDRQKLKEENPKIAHIFKSARKIIYVDNPPMKGYYLEIAKQVRKKSRDRLLTYLGGCQETYRPSNLDTLNERIGDYMTNEEKLLKEMENLEKKRIEEAEKYRKEVEELRKKQTEELNRMEEKNKKDIRDVEERGKEDLRRTKIDMESKHRSDIENLRQENKGKIDDLKSSYERDAQNLKSSFESQISNLQEQNRRDRQANENLISDLRKKNTSSASEITSALEKFNLSGKSNDDSGKWAAEVKRLDNIENISQRNHEARMLELKNQYELTRQQAAQGMQTHIEQKRGPDWGGIAKDVLVDTALTVALPPVGIIKGGIDVIKHIFS